MNNVLHFSNKHNFFEYQLLFLLAPGIPLLLHLCQLLPPSYNYVTQALAIRQVYGHPPFQHMKTYNQCTSRMTNLSLPSLLRILRMLSATHERMTNVNFIRSHTLANFEHAQKFLGASAYSSVCQLSFKVYNV